MTSLDINSAIFSLFRVLLACLAAFPRLLVKYLLLTIPSTYNTLSLIGFIVLPYVCCIHTPTLIQYLKVRKNNTHCILDEGAVLYEIAARRAEVGCATHDILTCQSYKAIQANAPRLVSLHCKQVDRLQTLLAKHHCPELLDELPPVQANVAADKPLKELLHKGTDDITGMQ
jgi:hypothetical protein